MSKPPTPGRRCGVEGCRSWAMRDQEYCSMHYHQWQQNLALGVPDPLPKLIGRNRRLCKARGCKHQAIANSDYCAKHAAQYGQDATNSRAIADGFAALLTRLDEAAPDCLAIVQRELDLLASARRILVAHAEMSSRAGWKAISSMTFIRLWLSSAATVTDLAKARFVMETATSADFDRLLGGVYARIERDALPEQQPLPGMLPASHGPDPALQPPLFPHGAPSPAYSGATVGEGGAPSGPGGDDQGAAPPTLSPRYSGGRVGEGGSPSGPEPGTHNPQPTTHCPQRRLASPEAQLAEWLIDANAALGTRLVAQTMTALVAESHKLRPDAPVQPAAAAAAAALTALTDALPPVLIDGPPDPAALAARLSTLAEIMDQSPDLAEARAIISRQSAACSLQPIPSDPEPGTRNP